MTMCCEIMIRKPNIHTSMRLQGHQDQVDALDFHPRRNIIASGGVSARILIHEINVANGLVQSASEIRKSLIFLFNDG